MSLQNCPACGAEVIQGEDLCPDCGQDLYELSRPDPSKGSMEERILRHKAGGLPLKPTVAVPPEASVEEVVRKMHSVGVGCALVVDPDRPPPNVIGILTERNILQTIQVVGGRFSLENLSARDLMTPNPESVRHDQPLAYALYKMNHGRFRHLPVFGADGKARILSVRDILAFFSEHIGADLA